jgi:HSP20 family molecular chaperone IbpA
MRGRDASPSTSADPLAKPSIASRGFAAPRGAFLSSHAWTMVGGDAFEDDRRLVVQLEVAGMDEEDFSLEVSSDEAHASHVHGVLKVELPKAEPGQPRAISVRID